MEHGSGGGVGVGVGRGVGVGVGVFTTSISVLHDVINWALNISAIIVSFLLILSN